MMANIVWTPIKRAGRKPKRDRVVPGADYSPQPCTPDRPVVLRTGRGDSRLTCAEARELAAQLDAAQRAAVVAEIEANAARAQAKKAKGEG